MLVRSTHSMKTVALPARSAVRDARVGQLGEVDGLQLLRHGLGARHAAVHQVQVELQRLVDRELLGYSGLGQHTMSGCRFGSAEGLPSYCSHRGPAQPDGIDVQHPRQVDDHP